MTASRWSLPLMLTVPHEASSGCPAVLQLPLSGGLGAVCGQSLLCALQLGFKPRDCSWDSVGGAKRPTPNPFMHGQCLYGRAILLTGGSVL